MIQENFLLYLASNNASSIEPYGPYLILDGNPTYVEKLAGQILDIESNPKGDLCMIWRNLEDKILIDEHGISQVDFSLEKPRQGDRYDYRYFKSVSNKYTAYFENLHDERWGIIINSEESGNKTIVRFNAKGTFGEIKWSPSEDKCAFIAVDKGPRRTKILSLYCIDINTKESSFVSLPGHQPTDFVWISYRLLPQLGFEASSFKRRNEESEKAKYDAFISHATEDKEEFVRPLAQMKLGVKSTIDLYYQFK